MPKIREQDRALSAQKTVTARKDRGGKEYRQELQQLPSRILASGLGQTLAFYASKGHIHKDIGDDLAKYLTGDKTRDTVEFLNQIMMGTSAEYGQMTRQALAYAEWLKRYSKAMIPD
jgi:CRISPR type III-B/RAMP module-associated protein Cmr5